MTTWEEYKKTMIGEPLIFEEARCGNREALREYLAQGQDIEVRNHRGYSLLMLAAYNDHFETVKFLLEQGASANSADHGGNTVLMGASFKGLVEIVRLLIVHGADVTLQNAHGMTAADFARVFGRHDVLAILCEDPPTWRDPLKVAAKVLKTKLRNVVSE